MLSKYRYLIVGGIILWLAAFHGITEITKDEIVRGFTAVLWTGLAVFWAWVYHQTKSRKLFVSKMLTILVIISILAAVRTILMALNLLDTNDTNFFTFAISLLVAAETYDLWVKAGRNSKEVANPHKDKDE